MEELIFIGRSDDNESLILASEEGREFFVVIDAHLVRDVTNRPTQTDSSNTTSTSEITPREIQSRIRRGESVEDIAAEAGVDTSRIERYAGPVLSERAYMATRARETYIRRSTEDEFLETAVLRQLSAINVDTLSLEWDSFRREDGRWNVSVRWSIGAGDGTGNWIYDPMSQSIISLDNEAKWLLEEESATTSSPTDVERPRLVGLPGASDQVRSIHAVVDHSQSVTESGSVTDGSQSEVYNSLSVEASGSDFIYDDGSQEVPGSEDSDYLYDNPNTDGDDSIDVPAWAGPGQPTLPVPAPLHAATSTPVDDSPSWDDILFGHRPSE